MTELTEIIQSRDPSVAEIAEFGEMTELTEIIQSRNPCVAEIAEFPTPSPKSPNSAK